MINKNVKCTLIRICMSTTLLLLSRVAFCQEAQPTDAASDTLVHNNIVVEYLEGDSTYWRRTMGCLFLRPTNKHHSEPKVKTPSEYEGYTVGNVDIVVLPPFGTSVADTVQRKLSIFEALANKSRFPTLKTIIRRNMTLAQGGVIDKYSIYDNERLLRSLQFINDVSIWCIKTDTQNEVDLIVIVQDRFPHALSGSATANKQRLSVYSRNVFGLGITLGASAINIQNKIGYETWIGYNNIGSSSISAELNFYNADSTRKITFEAKRPFVKTNKKYAGGLFVDYSYCNTPSDYMGQYVWPQNVSFVYSTEWLGRRFSTDGLLFAPNVYVAIQHISMKFNSLPDSATKTKYSNSHSLYTSFSVGKRNYFRQRLVYSVGRVEDIPTGYLFSMVAGASVVSQSVMPYYGISLSGGTAYGNSQGYLVARVAADICRVGKWQQKSAISLDALCISPLINAVHSSSRFFLNVGYVRGIDRDEGETIAFRGMRQGKPFFDNSIRGTERLLFSGELVNFTPMLWAGFRTTTFTFADLGWISNGHDLFDSSNHFSCIGVGLKLRNDRLVFGTMQIKLGLALTHNIPDFVDFSTESIPSFKDFAPEGAYLNIFK